MRKAVIAGIAVPVLAILAYVGFNAWLAWGLPARPVSAERPVKGCEGVSENGPNPIRAALQCRARHQEAALLKAHPGLAIRDGDTLSVFYRGQQTHRLIPMARGENACDAVEVHRAMALFDPVSGRTEQVALVSCHNGEFEDRFVALPDGMRWTVHDAAASPDGKMIATGSNMWLDGKGFDLYAWPSRRRVVHFQPSCRVIQWRDEAHIDVTCASDAAPSAFDARVWRGRDGVWRMQATRWLTGILGYTDHSDPEIAPGFSLRPLPRFTAPGGK